MFINILKIVALLDSTFTPCTDLSVPLHQVLYFSTTLLPRMTVAKCLKISRNTFINCPIPNHSIKLPLYVSCAPNANQCSRLCCCPSGRHFARVCNHVFERSRLRQSGLNSLQPTSVCGLAVIRVNPDSLINTCNADAHNLDSTRVQALVRTSLNKL